MKRFILSPAAVRDLQEIKNYIAKDSTTAARRAIWVIREKIQWLAENPGMGHYRDDLPDHELRAWNVYSYVIVYRHGTKPLEVARVVGGAQDLTGQPFG